MLLPNAVGNLQKGERYVIFAFSHTSADPDASYANMDYIVGSSLRASALLFIILSYDIACQWFANIADRMSHWPEEIKPAPEKQLQPLIPKLHEPGHKKANHEQYSFNFAPGVGQTDGECPERIWAAHNALGNATKTQGPGSRQDVLDDHFGFWNWQKYTGMGSTLMRRYKAAIRERNIQVEGHKGFTATLPQGLVDSWEDICRMWENTPHPRQVKNPYHTAGARTFVVFDSASFHSLRKHRPHRKTSTQGPVRRGRVKAGRWRGIFTRNQSVVVPGLGHGAGRFSVSSFTTPPIKVLMSLAFVGVAFG